MNRFCHLFFIAFLLIPMGGKLFADEKIVTGKFVVSLSAEANQKAWIVNALEQNIYNDLSGYGKIVPFNKVSDEEEKCKNRNLDCILEIYKKLNIDALMLGTVDDSDIDYEIYDVKNKFLVKTGSIDIGSGSSLLKLRMGAFSAFKPFLEIGGILEKRKYIASVGDDAQEPDDPIVENYSNSKLKLQVLIFLAGFSCFPYFLTFLGKPRRHPERSKIILRWFVPFLIVSLSVIGYQYRLDTTGKGNIFDILLNLFDGYRWVLTALGGIVWGYFLIIHFKIVIPHLQGIERIKPNILFPLLQSSLLTITIKTLLIATFYLGIFYGVENIGKLFSIDPEIMVTLLFPLSGLFIFYWIALMLDVFSMSIDVKLAGRKLDYNSVWNQIIRKYFIGYLKRNGVTLNKRLLKNIVFLPGENKGVVFYGGGLSQPRITIEKDLIKFAVGDIAESALKDTDEYDKKAIEPALRQNDVLKITPDMSLQRKKKKLFKSSADRKRARYLEGMRKYFQRDLTLQRGKLNNRTDNFIQGIVFPKLAGNDDFPPLMSDNFDEMQIVEELLLENSIADHRYDEETEIDDSNEQDKDFLFGALLHKFGGLLRHEDIFSTLCLYFRWKKADKIRTYNFLFSKSFAVVADTFVVLNFGLNHLMQHLFYQATNDSSNLTTKGITSGMLISQDDILTRTKEITDERKPNIIHTDELDRIIWLSRFCQDPIKKEQSNIQTKRILKWSFSIGVIYLASLVLIDSYNYHQKYLEIIKMEKHEIAQAINNEQNRERTEK